MSLRPSHALQLRVPLALAWLFIATTPLPAQDTASAIIKEATLPSTGPAGHPLPLVSTWNVGLGAGGYTLQYQLGKIRDGHYILPAVMLPGIESDDYPQQKPVPGWDELVELGLPLTLKSTQWEQILVQRSEFRELPFESNPSAYSEDGRHLGLLDPQAPTTKPYRDAGRLWGRTTALSNLQKSYPAPPKVIFLSNNEAPRMKVRNLETSRRFVEQFAKKGRSVDDFLDQRCDAIEQKPANHPMGALISELREQLSSWHAPATFIGFNSFGPRFYGRWNEWRAYAGASEKWLSCEHLVWGGASSDFYLDDWSPIRDDRGWSVQVEAQNWVFMLDEALAHNKNFWFELSIWDGNEKKRAALSDKIPFNEKRYAAAVRFGLWLLRPRVVREFRAAFEPVSKNEAYFQSLLDAVKLLHENPTLREFWRDATLVPNRARRHFYNVDELRRYRDVDRWFILEASTNASGPWRMETPVPVFALALVRGNAPNREWLVYAHAPMGSRDGVEIEVPEFGAITVDVPVEGAYFVVLEGDHAVERLATN